ncbi:MAG: hypothetical protein Tsb002_07770 [Wenzhouxiangellaceae bacterium]
MLLAVTTVMNAAELSAQQSSGSQSSRLRITNQCSYPIWIQQDFIHTTNDPVVVQIKSNDSYDYNIPKAGLAATRFWPKAQCNKYGYDCAIGESTGVPSAQAVGHQTTQTVFDADINSKFEATWGCLFSGSNASNCAANPSSNNGGKLDGWTYWDGSAVDGFTFAYKILVKGNNPQCFDQATGSKLTDPTVDCSLLDPAEAPTTENLSTNGQYNTINGINVTSVNLQYTAFTDPSKIIGSFSPCSIMTSGQWNGWAPKLGNLTPESDQAKMYCCPGDSVTSSQCSAGPAASSEYDAAIHNTMKCDAYAYAFDDAKGLAKCDAAAQYEVVYCPGGKSLPLPASPRTATTFCDPNTNPPQMCPNGNACPQCGLDSCPCP